MHYSHLVAIAGDVDAEKLADVLDDVMAPFDENRSVPLHRDTSVYAEHRDVQLAKARAHAAEKGELDQDDETLLAEWDGVESWTEDGWPMTTANPDRHWDYWRVAGRWANTWVLKDGADDGPIQVTIRNWDSPPAPDHERPTTNCARKVSIEAESIQPTYSWLDLDGMWHTKWIGPTAEQATSNRDDVDYSTWEVEQSVHDAKFLTWLASLPADTWLVHIDYHN